MKLPIAWLKKYIDVTLSAEKLAELLTMSGSKVENVKAGGADGVLEIEVTTNRPDTLSILGLAYEVSAITGKKVKRPAAYSAKDPSTRASLAQDLSIVIEDKKGCSRYTARIIRNVQVIPAPQEAQRFLSLAGTRAISSVVDATNYVLYECGQPLHAFDLDKLKGKQIIVRKSRQGEKFLGIDGLERTLDDKTLVIADAERPVAIAGVMGGKLTEVTSSTKNILLESAYFDPATVRRASKKYKITTESSYRFERSVDIENVGHASFRAAGLIREWANGEDVSGLLDKETHSQTKIKPVTLRLTRLEALLGLKVPQTRVSKILRSLSFSVKSAGTGKLLVTPPTFRRDIRLEADLIEEVLRIEGFDKAPETLPVGHYAREIYSDKKAERLPELKKFMAHQGFDEVMTYSLLSEKMLAQSGIDARKCHAVANASSAEQAYFRPSLLAGFLNAVQFNTHRKATSLKLFEIGNCYVQGLEETRLGMVLTGMSEENWKRKNESSLYDLKGTAGNVLDFLNAPGTPVRLEQVPTRILEAWDLAKPVFYCEITLDDLLAKSQADFKVRPIPKFPWVHRDIAFIVSNYIKVNELEQIMKQSGAPYLQEATLFDEYIGKNIPAGKRSLAFSLAYQKESGTFTEEEILSVQKKVGDALKNRFQVEFR